MCNSDPYFRAYFSIALMSFDRLSAARSTGVLLLPDVQSLRLPVPRVTVE